MTPPEPSPQPAPADRPGQYHWLIPGLLGVGMAFAGTAAAADIWPSGDTLDATTADPATAYLVALVGWGFACILWGIAAAVHARNGAESG